MCHRLSPIYQGVGSHRSIDVLKGLLAQISELYIHLAPDLIVGGSRDAGAARRCNALKPGRDVDAVPEDIMWLDDHVADIDADAESNAGILRVGRRKFSDAGLELRSSSDCLYSARKLGQEPVTGIL